MIICEQSETKTARASDARARADEEFLKGVRGRLSPVRKKLVRTIFDALDKVGGELGYLTIRSIEKIYSVSQARLRVR